MGLDVIFLSPRWKDIETHYEWVRLPATVFLCRSCLWNPSAWCGSRSWILRQYCWKICNDTVKKNKTLVPSIFWQLLRPQCSPMFIWGVWSVHVCLWNISTLPFRSVFKCWKKHKQYHFLPVAFVQVLCLKVWNDPKYTTGGVTGLLQDSSWKEFILW